MATSMLINHWNCYVLVLHLLKNVNIRLSKHAVTLDPGLYFYVGSSRRPGIVFARLTRHLSKSKRIHWHIDQLTTSPYVEIKGFYLIDSSSTNCESLISHLLAGNLSFIKGFGSTDKPRDKSHLFTCNNTLEECLHYVYNIIENSPSINGLLYVAL